MPKDRAKDRLPTKAPRQRFDSVSWFVRKASFSAPSPLLLLARQRLVVAGLISAAARLCEIVRTDRWWCATTSPPHPPPLGVDRRIGVLEYRPPEMDVQLNAAVRANYDAHHNHGKRNRKEDDLFLIEGNTRSLVGFSPAFRHRRSRAFAAAYTAERLIISRKPLCRKSS